MAIKTVNSTHQLLKDALEILESQKNTMENAKKEKEWSMLDIYDAKISMAEKQVVQASKDFVHYLSEACIKF